MFWTKKKGKPDFINEIGVKWWRIKEYEKHFSKNSHLPKLEGYTIWYVENGDHRAYLILYCDDIVYETQQLEALFCRIDLLRANKMYNYAEIKEI